MKGQHQRALVDLDKQIAALQASRWQFVGRASQERDEELLASKIEEWTKIREIFPFPNENIHSRSYKPIHCCASWWRMEGVYLRCFIVVSRGGQILTGWEVTDAGVRAKRSFNLIHGSCPDVVELEIKRQYGGQKGR